MNQLIEYAKLKTKCDKCSLDLDNCIDSYIGKQINQYESEFDVVTSDNLDRSPDYEEWIKETDNGYCSVYV